MKFLRIICIASFGMIHPVGTTGGGGMGDAVQCDVCGCDRYGDGVVIFDRSEDEKSLWDRFDAWTVPLFFTGLGWGTLVLIGGLLWWTYKGMFPS